MSAGSAEEPVWVSREPSYLLRSETWDEITSHVGQLVKESDTDKDDDKVSR